MRENERRREEDRKREDERRRQEERNKITTAAPKRVPDICKGSVDAISVLRGEIFAFKDDVGGVTFDTYSFSFHKQKEMNKN